MPEGSAAVPDARNLNPTSAAFDAMKDGHGYLTPPDLADGAGWKRVCEDGSIRDVAGSEVLKAYDYWRGDRLLAFKMRQELSRKIAVQLRLKISKSLPGQKAIFDEAVNVVARAAEEQASKRGLSFRKNFHHFVNRRGDDALERAGVIPHSKRDTKGSGRKAFAKVHVEFVEDQQEAASPEDALLEMFDIKRALHKLDARAKAAANMHYVLGDSLDDIAKALGTTRHDVTVMLEPLRSIRDGRTA